MAVWLPGARTFPRLPMVEGLVWPLAGQWLLLILAVLSLVGLLVRPFQRIWLIGFLSASSLLVLEDVSRLQPWLFSFALMLGAVLWTRERSQRLHLAMALVLSSTYVWSGIHKLNPNFAAEFFPWLANVLLPDEWLTEYPWLAYVAAGVELAAGVGLWIRPLRKYALATVVGLHTFILCSLGPWGHSWNPVVWPWNVVFALLAIAAFNSALPALKLTFKSRYAMVVLALATFAPALNFFGHWDHFLSASYYTNLSPEGVFYYHKSDRKHLSEQPGNHQFAVRGSEEEFIVLAVWALETLQVPGYPEERVYRQLGKQLCNCVDKPDLAGMHLVRKQRWRYDVEELKVPCSELVEGR